ncbi:MAG: GNAT family N-acetyltransferase [Bacilli bacterium]|nr:GNAT family N-acetyltransferase [Bacilli bacterium]
MNITSYETVELETDRLILKKGNIEDYVSVYEYDMRKVRDIGGEFEFEKQDPNEIKAWFKNSMEKYYAKCIDEKHTFDWIIYLKKEMIPIGNITADREREAMQACELAYNLHPTYWGQGYMPEAVTAVLDHLFSIGYDNVISGWDEGNKKSKRVSDKMGFELFNVIDEYWIKNGVPIATYESTMSKEKWYSMNNENMNSLNTSKNKR